MTPVDTELRCPLGLHARASGLVIEVRCAACSRSAVRRGHRVSVYHRWALIDGRWRTLDDRVVPHAVTKAAYERTDHLAS